MVCVCVSYWHCIRREFWYIKRYIKLFTTIPGACRVILGSTHPARYDVIHFLVELHNYLQHQAWKAQKTSHVVLDDSVPKAKNYRKHIYFVFKLGEPTL